MMKSNPSPAMCQMQTATLLHLTTPPQGRSTDPGKRTLPVFKNPLVPIRNHPLPAEILPLERAATSSVGIDSRWFNIIRDSTSHILYQGRLVLSHPQHNMNPDFNNSMNFSNDPSFWNGNPSPINGFCNLHPPGVAQQGDNLQYGIMCDEPTSLDPLSPTYTASTISGTTLNNSSGAENSPTLSSSRSSGGSDLFSPKSDNSFDEGVTQNPINANHWNRHARVFQHVQPRTMSSPPPQSSYSRNVQEYLLNQARHRAASQPQPPPSSMWPIPLYSSIDDVYYAPAYQIQSQHLVFPSDVSNLQPLTYDQDMAWMISNTETPTGNQIQTMSVSNDVPRATTTSPSAHSTPTPEFRCKHCHKVFKIKSGRENLSRHNRLHCRKNKMHRTDGPKCSKCGKTFSRKDNVQKHIRKYPKCNGESPSKLTA